MPLMARLTGFGAASWVDHMEDRATWQVFVCFSCNGDLGLLGAAAGDNHFCPLLTHSSSASFLLWRGFGRSAVMALSRMYF